MQVIITIFSVFILTTLGFTFYYSVRSRRQTDAYLRAVYAARMNIAMGLMLIAIALAQLFLFSDNWIRRTFGTILVLMGVFNLFVGIRHSLALANDPRQKQQI